MKTNNFWQGTVYQDDNFISDRRCLLHHKHIDPAAWSRLLKAPSYVGKRPLILPLIVKNLWDSGQSCRKRPLTWKFNGTFHDAEVSVFSLGKKRWVIDSHTLEFVFLSTGFDELLGFDENCSVSLTAIGQLCGLIMPMSRKTLISTIPYSRELV